MPVTSYLLTSNTKSYCLHLFLTQNQIITVKKEAILESWEKTDSPRPHVRRVSEDWARALLLHALTSLFISDLSNILNGCFQFQLFRNLCHKPKNHKTGKILLNLFS